MIPPLMFPWETCELFQTALEHRRIAASGFTLLIIYQHVANN